MNGIICLGQLSDGTSNPDMQGRIFAVMLLGCCGILAFARWMRHGPVSPNPWDEEVATDVERDEAVPLCHHCLEPHDLSVDFCPACGAAVGRYTNWLPYPYLFSVGHVLRIGTSGDFKQSALTITGFLFLGLVEYTVFAPIYWFMLARGINHHGRLPARKLPEESPTEGDQG